MELDFEIDKLTSSVENTLTAEVFETDVVRVLSNNKKQIKKADWVFDWSKEFKNPANEVYKLITVQNPDILHGLICVIDKGDHIFMSLIESAKFNKGQSKLYRGVAGNLVAFACKKAFEQGYNGVVSFIAKTQLIEHYQESLGAQLFGGGNRMFIDTRDSLKLVKQYFKNDDYGKF